MMKIARYAKNGQIHFGKLHEDGTLERTTSPFGPPSFTGARDRLDAVTLLAPVMPGRVFGVGLNYVNHIKEVNAATPKRPMLFMKPTTAIVGPGAPIVYPPEGQDVHYEAELAIVIGTNARRVTEADALDYVLGYTCANDVSERVIQREEMSIGCLVVSKGFDTFCPIGPVIVTDLDPSDLRVQARLNDNTRQDSRTSDLLFNVRQLVSYLSQSTLLVPGDIIITGTPAGVGPMVPGDQVEIEVEGIGILRNHVVAEDATNVRGMETVDLRPSR